MKALGEITEQAMDKFPSTEYRPIDSDDAHETLKFFNQAGIWAEATRFQVAFAFALPDWAGEGVTICRMTEAGVTFTSQLNTLRVFHFVPMTKIRWITAIDPSKGKES